jgi:dolichyl-phosphate beta-glucosyltransferase
MLAIFVSWMLRLPVHDTQCGAKVFRCEVAPALFGRPFVTRWLFDVELLARLRHRLGRDGVLSSVVEVPLDCWHEVSGSRLRLKDLLRVPLDLLRIRLHYNRRDSR